MPEAFPAWFTAKPESPSGEAISLLPTIVSITVVRDPASPLLKPIPIGIFPATPPGSARQLTLGPGNVLLLAQQIAANSAASTVTGFRIKAGTLTFPANITVGSGVVHIAPAETIQLDAVLDPPAAPPPVAGPGADATAAVATLPASVRIVFAPAGGQITTLPAFSAKVYGTSVALTHSLTAPHFDQLLQQILVPASAIPETFTIAADQSTLLALSGSAPITGGAWSLPVAAGLPPQERFSAPATWPSCSAAGFRCSGPMYNRSSRSPRRFSWGPARSASCLRFPRSRFRKRFSCGRSRAARAILRLNSTTPPSLLSHTSRKPVRRNCQSRTAPRSCTWIGLCTLMAPVLRCPLLPRP